MTLTEKESEILLVRWVLSAAGPALIVLSFGLRELPAHAQDADLAMWCGVLFVPFAVLFWLPRGHSA